MTSERKEEKKKIGGDQVEIKQEDEQEIEHKYFGFPDSIFLSTLPKIEDDQLTQEYMEDYRTKNGCRPTSTVNPDRSSPLCDVPANCLLIPQIDMMLIQPKWNKRVSSISHEALRFFAKEFEEFQLNSRHPRVFSLILQHDFFAEEMGNLKLGTPAATPLDAIGILPPRPRQTKPRKKKMKIFEDQD